MSQCPNRSLAYQDETTALARTIAALRQERQIRGLTREPDFS